jgi:phage tail tube protein FII
MFKHTYITGSKKTYIHATVDEKSTIEMKYLNFIAN